MAEEISGIIEEVSPYYKKKGKPSEEHELIYDSSSEGLEPVYFWILDFMNDVFGDVEKLVDNFSSSPGGGHFSEIGARATRMQEEGMKILGAVNTVLKSIINLIYDLKEWEIRLEDYNASDSKEKGRADAGLLALKQRWLDNVDVKRGRGSIHMMAQDLNFITLRDAFMAAKNINEVDKLDLNDRVKRILKPRIYEFFEWKKRSEQELRKRFKIEQSYLKSQVHSLKLYTRWVKPYLTAAENLKMKEAGREPSLVNIFNTLRLQLTLFGKRKIKVEDLAYAKTIPESFKDLKMKRDYYQCVLVDFLFRGIPQRLPTQQSHYVFGGRVEVKFKGYCLNEEEVKLMYEKLGESDVSDSLKLIEGITDDSLNELKEDLEKYMKGEEEKKEEEPKADDVNPFSALLGLGKKKSKTKDKKKEALEILKERGARKDNYQESLIRSYGESQAAEACFNTFDTYKKAHGMASHPSPFM